VQARLGSTRLPGKSAARLGDRPVIAWVLKRLARAASLSEVRLAAPEGAPDDPLAHLAAELGFPCTRGSLVDVLDRFLVAARDANADHVVRVSGDSPFIDPELIDAAVRAHLHTGAEYTRNFQPMDIAPGLCAEVIAREALERAAREAVDAYDREHVTPYFYRVSGRFRTQRVPVPAELMRPDLRLCVDTAEDLAALRAVVACFPGRDDFPAGDVIRLLDSRPDIRALNAGVEQHALARVCFWIDYGPRVGAGHLGRARALAAALSARGVDSLVCYRSGGERERAGAVGVRLEGLSAADGGAFREAFAARAAEIEAGCLILDNYSADESDVRALKEKGFKVVAVDDWARPLPADVLVNPNTGACEADYRSRPPGADILFGPQYALIPPELVRAAREAEGRGRARSERVLVVFGGSDPAELTPGVCERLLEADGSLTLEVVTGPLMSDEVRGRVADIAAAHAGGLTVHAGLPSLAALFASATLAVSAGGITKYELALFGVPAVLVSVADNQVQSTEGMAALEACAYAGRAFGPDAVGPAEIVLETVGLLADSERRGKIAAAARRTVDGSGANRIAERVVALLGV
jgi:spore coat polysaccharide biosynthesis protein SpsF (cytidylyltransferase family)/spore coat polysaccharide biosynthesis predicted glycosyltransferase SpsG